MENKDYYPYLNAVIDIARQAGEAIMRVYETDFDVEKKSDNSPLTQADLAAHHLIVNALKQLTPHIPVLSEESESIAAAERNTWELYWLIDPLDGTREFIKRNGEFTVNIALIHHHTPIMGVVYAPVTELLYFAYSGQGAFKQAKYAPITPIRTRNFNIDMLVIAGSRSHSDQRVQQFLANIHIATGRTPELISMGSSLKICLVAQGTADVYPRLGPTSEWDTASAHCVLKEAGGDIFDEKGHVLRYNTKQSLLNPHFFATGNPAFNWARFL